MEPVVQLLREIIALPSVNPVFLPAQDPRAGEKRIGEFLAATAARMGFAVEFQPVFEGRDNLIIRFVPAGVIRQTILLAPHLDTVGGEGLSDAFFIPRIKKGRLYGRGACDTKGSVAAMLTALGQLAQAGPRPAHTEIVFAGLVDEEVGQSGSRALVTRGFKADFAIVGEPTVLRVVTAHKGDLWIKLEATGRAAHGSRPDLGCNAIHRMAKIVDLLQTQYAATLRRRRHPLLGYPTISVGVIRGGTQPNIVPDYCSINVDRRTLPGETESSVRRELRAWLKKAGHQARLLNSKAAPCWPMETNPRQRWVRELMRCAHQTQPLGVDFFCDASILSRGGIPSVMFGPGDIAQAHTRDEWISLKSLERGARLLTRFLQSLP